MYDNIVNVFINVVNIIVVNKYMKNVSNESCTVSQSKYNVKEQIFEISKVRFFFYDDLVFYFRVVIEHLFIYLDSTFTMYTMEKNKFEK